MLKSTQKNNNILFNVLEHMPLPVSALLIGNSCPKFICQYRGCEHIIILFVTLIMNVTVCNSIHAVLWKHGRLLQNLALDFYSRTIWTTLLSFIPTSCSYLDLIFRSQGHQGSKAENYLSVWGLIQFLEQTNCEVTHGQWEFVNRAVPKPLPC